MCAFHFHFLMRCLLPFSEEINHQNLKLNKGALCYCFFVFLSFFFNMRAVFLYGNEILRGDT